ncbi:MAG: S-adenosylmethionine decarboxylase [PVC group bacterium]|nr:S-adenosylmethionine decarboxylase [PVC group bacterium]
MKKKGKKIFGYELVLDLFECDADVITSKKKLKEYVDTLCKLIKMKKYGKTLLPYFGEKEEFTKGYSLVQLIETSSITGHFSDYWKTAYINIFSCREYDQNLAKKFSKEFFGAKRVKSRFLVR